MDYTDEIPKHVLETIEQTLGPSINIKSSVKGDITNDGWFNDIWVIVSDTRLIVSSDNSVKSYTLNRVKELRITNLTTGGMLIGNIDGEDIILCRYSNKLTKDFGQFCKDFSELQESQELQDKEAMKEGTKVVEDVKGRGDREKAGGEKHKKTDVDRRRISLRLLSYVWKYKFRVFVVLLFMILSSLLGLARPYIEGQVLFDQVFIKGGKYYGKLGFVIGSIVMTQLLSLLISILHGRISAKISAEVVCDVKIQVFEAMQRLPMSFFVDSRTGTLMNRINNDSATIQNFLTDGFAHLIINLLTLIGIIIMVLKINWILSIIVLIPALITIIGTRSIFPKISRYFSQRFRKSSRLNSFLNDSLMGMRVVKAFGKEKKEIERFTDANKDLSDIEIESAKYIHTIFPLYSLVLNLSGLAVWGIGIWMIIKQDITFGMLISFTQYLSMLYGPLQFMVRIVEWWSDSTNAAHRIFEIIDTRAEMQTIEQQVKPEKIEGNIRFEGVTFSYEPNKPVLHKLDIDINSGEMIGIAGQSGAGKSTIIKLLTKLYDTDEGKIAIDGLPLDYIDDRFFKEHLAVVPQETFLFSGTIWENIVFSKPDASEEDIIIAAKIANAHDFILDLPDGYDTLIGARGQDLSGGEKQRISIARAILRNPRILILDEATSSLDTETELRIQEAMERLVEGRTTISIAHRLSTLKDADRIIVIDEGRIVEEGEHQYLIDIGGNYYNMVELQRRALEIGGRVD